MEQRKKLIKSEVIKLFNTTKETLRYYERHELIQPEIDENQYRYYDVQELNRLRQAFVLKDLGFSIKETKELINQDISQEAYLSKIKAHTQALDKKIKHLEKVKLHAEQLTELLSRKDFSVSFKVQYYKKRKFILINPFVSHVMEGLKSYYDTFYDLIQSDVYSERVLMSVFDFDQLSDFKKESSDIGIEVDVNLNLLDQMEELILEEGTYLSVFYIFMDWDIDILKELKKSIETYCNDHNLIIVGDKVVEIEHPELGVLFEENQGMYELQIGVKMVKETIE